MNTPKVHPSIQRRRDRARAITILKDLVGKGHALQYIADTISDAGVPVLSGRPGQRWWAQSVQFLARAEGIEL